MKLLQDMMSDLIWCVYSLEEGKFGLYLSMYFLILHLSGFICAMDSLGSFAYLLVEAAYG